MSAFESQVPICCGTHNQQPQPGLQASGGIKALIMQTIEQCHSAWLLRNEYLHGKSPFQNYSCKHLHLIAQVSDLCDSAPLMLASDRDIFDLPIETRRHQTTATMKYFCNFAKAVMDLSTSKAADMGMHFRDINDCFPPMDSPGNMCYHARLGWLYRT
jgi:hypothetical protein